MPVIPAHRRLTIAGAATAAVLGLALIAATDLGFTALAVVLSTINPRIGLIADAGAVLSYFTFYPSVLIAAVTLAAGAFIAWRIPRVKRVGLAAVTSGVLSATFVVVALLPHVLR